MAVGIVNIEAAIAVKHGLELVRDLKAAAGQVGPELLGVGGLKRDVGEAVLPGILELGKNFDVLVVVDLEIGQHEAATFVGWSVHGKRLLEAEDVAVKCAGF